MNAIPTARKRRTREEWQQLIEAQSSSAMTQTAFCAANGVSLASFHNWKRKLAMESDQPAPPEPWIDLGTLNRPEGTGWDIELDLGQGVYLRLRRC